jgi:hypothetical protein
MFEHGLVYVPPREDAITLFPNVVSNW